MDPAPDPAGQKKERLVEDPFYHGPLVGSGISVQLRLRISPRLDRVQDGLIREG